MTPEEQKQFREDKAQQEANRDAYLLRKHGAEGLWKLRQQWLSDLARLRPDLQERLRMKTSPPGQKESI